MSGRARAAAPSFIASNGWCALGGGGRGCGFPSFAAFAFDPGRVEAYGLLVGRVGPVCVLCFGLLLVLGFAHGVFVISMIAGGSRTSGAK